MTLWDFATKLYSKPGVAAACLALQDQYAVDVNQLMFAAWVGFDRGTLISAEDFIGAAQHVQHWRERVVAPLREVRRCMKDGALSSFHPASCQIREQVKEVELRAEKLQLQALETWAVIRFKDGGEAAVASAFENVREFLRLQVLPPSKVEPGLIAALGKGLHQLQCEANRPPV